MSNNVNDNYDKFDTLNKSSEMNVFVGMSSMDEKRFFLKLRREYLIIKNIKDYKERQNKLYANKTRKDIIDFEIARIRKSDGFSSKIEEQINGILELLEFIGDSLTDDLYEKIVNLIIRIELSLDMKIGLFEELCTMFDKIIKESTKDNISSNDVLKYKRTKGE